MPLPGPRTQSRPLPGYTNPDGEFPDRFNHWHRPGPVQEPGRTPGTMTVSLRGHILAPGTVRMLWRQTVNYIGGQASYSWTHNTPAPGRPTLRPGGFGITRAIRYMTRNLYVWGGTDNSRYAALHTKIKPRVKSKPVTRPAGGVRNRPTVRNRMTSFGARVTPMNNPHPSAGGDE